MNFTRTIFLTCWLALIHPLVLCAQEAATPAANPPFVDYPLYPSGQSEVFGVARGTHTDFVLLENGLDQGLRIGALCTVFRDGARVGELILVEVRDDRSAALITRLESGQSILSGDTVRLKTR